MHTATCRLGAMPNPPHVQQCFRLMRVGWLVRTHLACYTDSRCLSEQEVADSRYRNTDTIGPCGHAA